MLLLQVAKWVGDIFNKGLYDGHILLKKIPFLEQESPRQQVELIAEDVMNSSGSKLTYLYPITRVRSIEQILRTTVHSAFPIVTPVRSSSIPDFPKNVKSHHTPQLITHPSVRGEKESGDDDSKECERKKLVFRGLILRHQLVTLLKNHCFFKEADGVSPQELLESFLSSLFFPHSRSLKRGLTMLN